VPFARSTQEQRSTRQLTDVQHVSRKEQSLTEDWHKEIGILASADGAKQNDVRVAADALRQRDRGSLERGDRRGRASAA
jgi:hypothetical protein